MRYVDLVRSQGEDPGHLWGDPRGDPAVWAAHNPYDLAPRLRGTQLFVAAGTGQPGPLDPAGTAASTIESSLAAENAALAQRLRALMTPDGPMGAVTAPSHCCCSRSPGCQPRSAWCPRTRRARATRR